MNPKLQQELIDLAHLLHQAIIADDDRIAEAALADLRLALVEDGENGESGESSRRLAAPTDSLSSLRGLKFKLLRADNMATMVMRGNPEVGLTPVVAHIRKFATCCTAEIYRDGDAGPLVDLTVYGGFDRTRRVTKGTIRGLMSSLGHRWRLHHNKRARKDSATQVNG